MERFGSAIILAGGKSNRMGYNKELIEIKEEKMILSQVDRIRSKFEEVIVVTNNAHYYEHLKCITTSDIYQDKGPLAGIHAGLKKASSQYVYVLACDMPIINMEYIDFQINILQNGDYFSCITQLGDWIEPFNAFYSKKIIPHIEAYFQNGGLSVHGLVKGLNSFFIDEKTARKFSPTWEMFLNFNTKEDIIKYIKNGRLECG